MGHKAIHCRTRKKEIQLAKLRYFPGEIEGGKVFSFKSDLAGVFLGSDRLEAIKISPWPFAFYLHHVKKALS